MSRHCEEFEKHGVTTRTLERAPLAREAFYTSDWPGARALVQSNDESKVCSVDNAVSCDEVHLTGVSFGSVTPHRKILHSCGLNCLFCIFSLEATASRPDMFQLMSRNTELAHARCFLALQVSRPSARRSTARRTKQLPATRTDLCGKRSNLIHRHGFVSSV